MAIFSSLLPAKRRDRDRDDTSRHFGTRHGHRHGHRHTGGHRHDHFDRHSHGDHDHHGY
ncbi:hypothetical protein [Streptomyces sp. NBC_00557]|jgi:hypothetical protein|uniref:hypothetical protein n=1 Tax=Streptomyces sp. NBC_00557 TaxID=2975776 RepID=UPI002E810388|nr:hypothetical protein [Streptomyces sp. NBC_00557]WUC38122.1 hypothetical protein OG956_29790 [Streptomyces sp. NBC_00557]